MHMQPGQLSQWSRVGSDLSLQTTGLDSELLTLVLVVLSLLTMLWGFERYRSTFSRSEFLISIVLSIGIFVVGIFPDLFDRMGSLLAIERRSMVISLLANATFIVLVLYLLARARTNQAAIGDLTRSRAVEQANMESSGLEIAVTIPAYNEEKTIQSVIRSLPDSVHSHELTPIVISDGSTDRTSRVAKAAGAIVVEHPINQGQGGALKTGFEIARQRGAEIVVTMDADGQHPVDKLEPLVEPIITDEADYVMGSRYTGSDESGNGYTRHIGIQAFTTLINVMTKADITDSTNGFRAIRGSKLGELTLTEERFSAPELIIEAQKNGLRIQELPVTIAERQADETKKPKLGYAVGLTRTILMTWVR